MDEWQFECHSTAPGLAMCEVRSGPTCVDRNCGALPGFGIRAADDSRSHGLSHLRDGRRRDAVMIYVSFYCDHRTPDPGASMRPTAVSRLSEGAPVRSGRIRSSDA